MLQFGLFLLGFGPHCLAERTDGWTDGRMDGQTDKRRDGRMDPPMDGPTDGWTDGWTDTARCRIACPRLKIGNRAFL